METIEKNDWNNFGNANDFLKAVNVQDSNEIYVCTKWEIFVDQKRNQINVLRLTLERNGRNYIFDLNRTNRQFLQQTGITKPSEIVGKKLYFRKVFVVNPTTNREVESLRILKVESPSIQVVQQ